MHKIVKEEGCLRVKFMNEFSIILDEKEFGHVLNWPELSTPELMDRLIDRLILVGDLYNAKKILLWRQIYVEHDGWKTTNTTKRRLPPNNRKLVLAAKQGTQIWQTDKGL